MLLDNALVPCKDLSFILYHHTWLAQVTLKAHGDTPGILDTWESLREAK